MNIGRLSIYCFVYYKELSEYLRNVDLHAYIHKHNFNTVSSRCGLSSFPSLFLNACNAHNENQVNQVFAVIMDLTKVCTLMIIDAWNGIL